MRSVLVEWHLLHNRRKTLASYLDFELRAFLRRREWQIRGTDRDTEGRTQCAAPHLAARRAVVRDWVSVARKCAVLNREPDELARNSRRFLPFERFLPHEVALLELDQPAESCFIRRGAVVDVVAIERHSHLETQRVARAKSGWCDGALAHERLPHLDCSRCVEVELEAILACVTGARQNDPRHARYGCNLKMIVRDIV